jgi:hypothetical protein
MTAKTERKTPPKPRKAKPRKAKSPAPKVDYQPRLGMTVFVPPGASPDEAGRSVARQLLSPEMSALRVVCATEEGSQTGALLDRPAALLELSALQRAVAGGDLSMVESMLLSQAVSLQTLYVRLVERGLKQEWAPQFETLLRLAFKAQALSRQSLEAIGEIKHGPAVFARQTNISHGAPQLVNNAAPGLPTPSSQLPGPNAGAPFEIPQSKVLEAHGCKGLDAISTPSSSGGD